MPFLVDHLPEIVNPLGVHIVPTRGDVLEPTENGDLFDTLDTKGKVSRLLGRELSVPRVGATDRPRS